MILGPEIRYTLSEINKNVSSSNLILISLLIYETQCSTNQSCPTMY